MTHNKYKVRVFLCWSSGHRAELSTVPYHVFRDNMEYVGASDIEYERWLRDNDLNDIVDYDFTNLDGDDIWIETTVEEI